MKILIYGINYWPELTGIGKYNGEMADWLAVNGFEVRVVTAPPYYPGWKIKPGYSGWSYKKEKIGNVLVFRCPLYVPTNPSGFKRVIHLCSFAFSSFFVTFWQAITWKPDVIFTVAPAIVCAPGAWLSARCSGAKSWLHIQDFELDAAFQLGFLKSKYLLRLARVFEWVFLKLFDRVSSLTPAMQNLLRHKGVAQAKKVLLPNWVDAQMIYPIENVESVRQQLGILKEDIVVLYSGTMANKQGLEILPEIVSRLQGNTRIKFILCGEGPIKELLQQQLEKFKNVRFLDLQPIEKFNDFLNAADIHVIFEKNKVKSLMMPSKLSVILGVGGVALVMADRESETSRVALAAGGCCSDPGDAEGFARQIIALSENAALRKEIKLKARTYCLNNFEKEKILGSVLKPAFEMLKA